MLELIVLGQVPGTSYQITFSGVLVATVLLSILYALKKYEQKGPNIHQ